MKLSVIIPCYNEEKRLGNTLRDIDKYLSSQSYDYEILVVDGGSSDRTVKIAKKMQLGIKNLKVIDKKENHGKGYVVRQGMLKSRGNYCLFTDADNSTSIDHIEKMWSLFEKGFDVVIGSRDEKDAPGAYQAVSQPAWKRTLGNIGNIVIQMVAIWGIWDTQCGFKAFNKKAAQEIFKRAKANGWAFDVEALGLAKKLGYKIGIIPVFWVNSAESKVKLKGYFSFLKELCEIKLNFIFNRYGK